MPRKDWKKSELVEYVGVNNNKKTKHGNSIDSGKAYTRTDPKILQEAYQKIGQKKASAVVVNMCNVDEMNAPKSTRQLQDKILREKNKTKADRSEPKNNMADEVLQMLNAVHDGAFIQEVTVTKSKESVITLYSDEQLIDMKRNCTGKDGSVIGVDRTFNLGRGFVTATSYKNRSVESNKTGQYPVFLGPLCLHYYAEQSTYHKFFFLIYATN